jgi:hypothetical protein
MIPPEMGGNTAAAGFPSKKRGVKWHRVVVIGNIPNKQLWILGD